MRRKHRTDLAQPDIVDALRACGDKVDIIGRPVDLLVRSGRVRWTAEVKTPGKDQEKRQPCQVEHAKDATASGAPHYVLMSVEEALRARQEVQK